MQIEVVIRNVTPIFSAAPGKARVSIDGVINPPGDMHPPLTRARTMKVVADSGDGVAKVVHLPVVPGNTMRNLLRRTMLKSVIEPALQDKQQQLTIGAYTTAYAGSASGNPDGVPSTFDEVVTMRAHPFLGLFGGGPRMLQGRLMVDTLYPIHKNSERIIGNNYINDSISSSITEVVWTRRNDPVLEMDSAEDAAVIQGGVQAANDWITGLLESGKSKKAKGGKKGEEQDAAEDSSERGLRAFNAHEVVIPGVKWVWRLNADSPTDAQIGLILLALNKLTQQRIAGGHAKDYGRFEIEAVVLNGAEVWSPAGIAGAETEKYFDAVAEALDGITSVEFEQFAASAKDA